MCRPQQKSWCLPLTVLALDERDFIVWSLQVVSNTVFPCPHYALPLQPIQRPLWSDMDNAFSLSQWLEKWLGRLYTMDVDTFLYADFGRVGDNEEVANSTSVGRSRYFSCKTVSVRYGSWLLLWFLGICWPLPSPEHHADMRWAVHEAYKGNVSEMGESSQWETLAYG